MCMVALATLIVEANNPLTRSTEEQSILVGVGTSPDRLGQPQIIISNDRSIRQVRLLTTACGSASDAS